MGQRVCVTGASGQAGRAVVRELREHGYDVVATDAVVTREDLEGGMLRADLTDYGQAIEALQAAEGPGGRPPPGATARLRRCAARTPSSTWRTSRRLRSRRRRSRSPRTSR